MILEELGKREVSYQILISLSSAFLYALPQGPYLIFSNRIGNQICNDFVIV